MQNAREKFSWAAQPLAQGLLCVPCSGLAIWGSCRSARNNKNLQENVLNILLQPLKAFTRSKVFGADNPAMHRPGWDFYQHITLIFSFPIDLQGTTSSNPREIDPLSNICAHY